MLPNAINVNEFKFKFLHRFKDNAIKQCSIDKIYTVYNNLKSDYDTRLLLNENINLVNKKHYTNIENLNKYFDNNGCGITLTNYMSYMISNEEIEKSNNTPEFIELRKSLEKIRKVIDKNNTNLKFIRDGYFSDKNYIKFLKNVLVF